MRYPALLLLITVSLAFTALTAAPQKPKPAARPADTDFLPAGPFLFEPGAIHPIFMDAFGDRPVVRSPDGKLAVTVTGPKESYAAWVTIDPSAFPDGPVQVWPIQISVDVLWAPDSEAFAVTDYRYANLSYVLVFGTRFRMGESEPELGVPIADLTPIVHKDLKRRAQEFYAPDAYGTDLIYVKVLRWVGNDQLLVGLDARTSLTTPHGPNIQDMRIREWCFGYLVDVRNKTVVRELSEGQLLSQYRIRVAK